MDFVRQSVVWSNNCHVKRVGPFDPPGHPDWDDKLPEVVIFSLTSFYISIINNE